MTALCSAVWPAEADIALMRVGGAPPEVWELVSTLEPLLATVPDLRGVTDPVELMARMAPLRCVRSEHRDAQHITPKVQTWVHPASGSRR